MNGRLQQSFVDFDKMKVVETKEEFREILNEALLGFDNEEGLQRGYLSNLDLSEIDVSEVWTNFNGWKIENVAFSRFRPETEERKKIFGLSFVGAYLSKVSFVQAKLVRCNFDTKDHGAITMNASKVAAPHTMTEWEQAKGKADHKHIDREKITSYKNFYFVPWLPKDGSPSKLEEVDFFLSELEFCRFRNTYVMAADFRYAHVSDCSMSEGCFFGSDFYFCTFMNATNFVKSRFIQCSFTNAIFENNCIRLENIPSGVLQENYQAYSEIVSHYPNWIRYNPCFNYSSLNHEENNGNKKKSDKSLKKETAEFYKQLSGIYAGKGLNRDSNRAYKKAKQNERRYNRLSMWIAMKEGNTKDFFKHLWGFMNNIITAMFGYGYQWQAAVFWFFLLITIFGYIYYRNTGADMELAFSYSFNNSLGPFEGLAKIVGLFLASCQTALGMLLIGFLGFIVANNIRNDS